VDALLILALIVLAALAYSRRAANYVAGMAGGSELDYVGNGVTVDPSYDSGALSNISEAIAKFEGFYKPGSIAQRSNNPGNIGTFGGKVSSYADVGDGWDALGNWISGHASSHPDWDFYDTMRYYLTGSTTGIAGPNQDPDSYAEYVANYLGVDPTTPVSSVLG